MVRGRREGEASKLDELRRRCRTMVGELPADVRLIEGPTPYPVSISEKLDRLARRLSGSEK